MKVLLVYPEFPDTYWSFKHALSFEGKKSAFPPLGLLTVSAMLPESWERRLVDMNVRKLKQADVEWADVVFASAMIAVTIAASSGFPTESITKERSILTASTGSRFKYARDE